MRVPLRIAGFGLVLAAVLTGGYAVGAAVDVTPTVARSEPGAAPHGERDTADQKMTEMTETADVAGLATTEHGYTLRLDTARAAAGDAVPLAFTIIGPDGSPVRSYQMEHEKELHLIAVRRDFAGYQHVHPTRDAAGRWSATVDLLPGSWRLFADFVPGDGSGVTLGADLEVGGAYAPAPPAPPGTAARAGDLEVTLTGRAQAGTTSQLGFTLTRAGRQVEPEPYLGARGHLVALREGDLAYLHVHPDRDALSFATEVPSAGRYRLFLDVKVDGEVHTAAFTMEVQP